MERKKGRKRRIKKRKSQKGDFCAAKSKKVRKKYGKTLDKVLKKWYHIYIIGDTYALFAPKRVERSWKKGLFKPPKQKGLAEI